MDVDGKGIIIILIIPQIRFYIHNHNMDIIITYSSIGQITKKTDNLNKLTNKDLTLNNIFLIDLHIVISSVIKMFTFRLLTCKSAVTIFLQLLSLCVWW